MTFRLGADSARIEFLEVIEMPNQQIQGTLDVEGPAQATPFTVLSVNAGSFGVPANLSQSYFISASDIGAAPPNGVRAFGVRGDGLVSTRSIEASGTVNITGPSSSSQFNVLTVNAGSFGNPGNLVQSYFIIASDIGAAPPNGAVKFSVRGDGLVTAGQISSPTISALQNNISSLQAQINTLASLQAQVSSLRSQVTSLQNTLQSDVNGIAQSLVTLAARCTSLEQRVTDLGG